MIGAPSKTKKEAEAARFEAQADAILVRDAALLRDLGVHADALRRCYEELMLSRNDPQYVRTLEEHEKDCTSVNKASQSCCVSSGKRGATSLGFSMLTTA